MFLENAGLAAGIFLTVTASLTYVFRVRPWLDEREIARTMRRK